MPATFANQLLIAMPNLKGDPFKKSVIYICQHDKNGAMGLVLTYPIKPRLCDLFTQLDIPHPENTTIIQNTTLYLGGTTEPDHGFILHSYYNRPLQSSMQVSSELFITTSKDILIAIGENNSPPQNYCIVLGYSNWAPGQLEKEIQEGIWLNSPPYNDVIFETDPSKKWDISLRKLGINDKTLLSGFNGHA